MPSDYCTYATCEEPATVTCGICDRPRCGEHSHSYSHESEDPGVVTFATCWDDDAQREWLRGDMSPTVEGCHQ